MAAVSQRRNVAGRFHAVECCKFVEALASVRNYVCELQHVN
jgi:hypothetical protein